MSNSRRRKIYGKAYPITRKEARAYERVDKPRSYKSNPMGVTRMSTVNGRGSYRSARQAAAGKTPTERLSRARKVMRNGSMAGFLRNRKSGAATRRAAAKRAGAKKKGTKRNVTRTTMKTNRRKVPGTNYYKTSSGRYQNAKGKFVKASSVKRNVKRKTAPKRKTTKKRVRRNATVGATKSYSSGYERMKRSQAAKKAAATRKRRQRAAARSAGKKRTVGRYSRLKLEDPRTGKTRRSYMYKTSKGKRRRIPAKAIVKSGHKTPAQIRSGRAKAAARIKREGSAFVANKRKSSARQKRAGRRLAAYSAAKRRGASVKKAKAAALRAVPLVKGDTFKGTTKVGPLSKGRRKKVRIAGKKRTLVGNRRRKTTRRRVRRNGNTTTMRNNRRRRKTAAKRRSYKKNRRVGTVKRKTYPNRRRRKASKRRSPVRRNRRRTTKMRRNRRRTYRRNQGFMKTFQKAFVTGLWVTGGFLTHRVVTNLVCDPIFDLFKAKNGNGNNAQAGIGQTNGGFNIDHWKQPICGAGVLAIGLPLVGMVAKKRAVEVGTGMMVSWIHSLIVSISRATNQENIIKAVGDSRSDWSGRSWPYPSSRAAALGRRRRGVRGVGAARHTSSIMPRYTPTSMGQYQQAAAGQVYQAAAGQPGFQQAAAGEYITPMNATGEYFAPQATQGVGSYEAAGQLAMPRNNQVIQDGIRPDANLDREMSMMEAAAGLRGGVGSYFEQTPGGQVNTVPRSSTWIPGTSDGALWAGETPVDASQQTSELSAGILNVPGGNGILSGG